MLQIDAQGPVLLAQIDRPDVRNAFNDTLIAALTELFVGLKPEVRVVVLSGNGPTFCAGGDLEWMKKAATYTEEENVRDAVRLAELFEAMAQAPAVVISKVHGAAFGGGCGLVAASDVAVAADGTKFCFSEVKLGLIPATISSFVVPKIGVGHARHLFTTAEVFEAKRAYEIGLIHGVCSADSLDGWVEERVALILKNGPQAVAMSKQIAQDTPLDKVETARRLALARAGAEGREGVAAFLEKRKANFVVDR